MAFISIWSHSRFVKNVTVLRFFCASLLEKSSADVFQDSCMGIVCRPAASQTFHNHLKIS